jgi:hypothetical protein
MSEVESLMREPLAVRAGNTATHFDALEVTHSTVASRKASLSIANGSGSLSNLHPWSRSQAALRGFSPRAQHKAPTPRNLLPYG